MDLQHLMEKLKQYALSLINQIPQYEYEALLSVFCLSVVVLLAIYGVKKGYRRIFQILLSEYVILLYSSTLLLRDHMEKCGPNFEPFWSYTAIQGGNEHILVESIMNVVAFIPLGILLNTAFSSIRWWQIISVGCAISVSIEILQFTFKRGYAETDDVIHNTLGCFIGYGITMIILKIISYIQKYGKKKNLLVLGAHE